LFAPYRYDQLTDRQEKIIGSNNWNDFISPLKNPKKLSRAKDQVDPVLEIAAIVG